MAVETYDWSTDYSDEQSGTTTTFTSATTDTVDVTVSQPDPSGWYRTNRDGFEANTQMGGNNSGYFEMGVNFPNASSTVTTEIRFDNNSASLTNSVRDVSFTLYDIDSTSNRSFQDQVTVRAWDADGNEITVTLTAVDPTVVTIVGNVATAIPGAGSGPSGSVAANSTEGNVQVSIAGEVSRIEIIYGNGSLVQSNPANQAIGFSDMSFDLQPAVPCFVRGTRLRAMNGQIPVEALRAGDLLMTVDNGLQPVRWVGSKTVGGRGEIAPVRFETGAIGNRRPLLLSPRHKVAVSHWKAQLLFGEAEVLVEAIHMVNGADIRQVQRDRVEYFHVMFDEHELIYAEGARAESLFFGDWTADGLNQIARIEIDAFRRMEGGAFRDIGHLARTRLRRFEAQLLQ